MLQTGEWQIADTCPELIEAIPSRRHDDKRPGDVLKVAGDPRMKAEAEAYLSPPRLAGIDAELLGLDKRIPS